MAILLFNYKIRKISLKQNKKVDLFQGKGPRGALRLFNGLQVSAVKRLDKIFKSLTIPPMAAGQFSQTDRKILGFSTLVLIAGIFFNLYKQNNRAVSPGLLLSTLEVPPSHFAVLPKENVVSDFAPLDLNRAELAELEHLPGIGPALAQRILEYRAKNGPLKNVRELLRVPGIGPKKLAELASRVQVTPTSERTPTKTLKEERQADAGTSLDTSLSSKAETP
jgi:competence ComEA-like helix-hairpin-helix protein